MKFNWHFFQNAIQMFHLCPELECNKKYKTKHGLVKHLLEIHQIVDPVIDDPIEITKDNKKRVEEKKNSNKREEQQEALKKEIEAKKQLELVAKQEAEEAFRQEQIQKYRAIEEQKLEQEMKQLELNEKYLRLSSLIESRIEKNEMDCCICSEKEADTATIPCGHKSFCHECITEYRRLYPNKGCPICREDIVLISKIFS